MQSDLTLDELLGEDIGSTITRKGPVTELSTELRGPRSSASSFWQDTQEDFPDQHAASTKPIVIVTAAAEAPPDTKKKPEATSGGQPSKKKVKKKRKRDEIDDIFASL